MEVSGKALIYGILITLVLFLILASLGVFNFSGSSGSSGNSASGENSNIPEKCKLPSGTDVGQWKEHLGHHAETQECLNYFN